MFHSALNFLHNIYQNDLNTAKAVAQHINPLKGNSGNGQVIQQPLPQTPYHAAQGLQGQFPYPLVSQGSALHPAILQHILASNHLGVNNSDVRDVNLLTAPPAPPSHVPLQTYNPNSFTWQSSPAPNPLGYGFERALPIQQTTLPMQNYMRYQ